MVYCHGKNTQFRDLCRRSKWTKGRLSVIYLRFLTVKHFVCFFRRSTEQFRQIGWNCKGKHRERSCNVSLFLIFCPLLLFSRTIFLFCISFNCIFCEQGGETRRPPPTLSEVWTVTSQQSALFAFAYVQQQFESLDKTCSFKGLSKCLVVSTL